MVKQLRSVLVKSAKNPMYFWYFLQNVHPVRDHFPRLFSLLRRKKYLNLGDKSNLNKLHVILRTTDFVMNTNSARQLEDIGIKSRIDVIRIVRRQDIGLLSLFGNKLYSRIFNTCCTFFITAKAVRQFEKKLRMYDGWEDGSINCIWKQGICLAPLGWTMAEHLHRCDLSPTQHVFPAL